MKTYKYHYVYRITNLITGYHYYGSKSCNEMPKENIGKKYFSTTTNKLFVQDQKNNPEDYKYKIIKIFETTRQDAINLESDLHYKFDVKNHPKFINKSNQTKNGFDMTGRKNKRNINGENNPNFNNKWSADMKNKLMETKKINPYRHSEDRIEKIREASKGSNNGRAKKWKLISPNGIEYFANGNLAELCKSLDLAYTSVIGVYNGSYLVGERSKYSKWKLEEISI